MIDCACWVVRSACNGAARTQLQPGPAPARIPSVSQEYATGRRSCRSSRAQPPRQGHVRERVVRTSGLSCCISCCRGRRAVVVGVLSAAATGELACECDRLQFELGEGPSFGALDEAAPISVPDMRTDSRWPRFAPRAAENSLPTRSPRMRPLPSRMPRWKAICARRWPVERRSGGPSAF